MKIEHIWRPAACAVAGAVLAAPPIAADTPPEPSHTYDMHWTVRVSGVPDGTKEVRVWIPVPQQLPEQEVSDITVKTDAGWAFVEDSVFHNRMLLVTAPDPGPVVSAALSARVLRKPVLEPKPAVLTPEERALYLRPEALVSLSPRIHALADSIGGSSRQRYDYVLASMTYDKTVPGWGRGDSERACQVGRGNCTDFHSLFMSLSRAEKIPALFEMGYAMLPGGETDHVGGYHCWAWFYSDAVRGWVPVDIAEADQHPERVNFLFGHLDADRVAFSRGRDVRVPGMHGKPLNYLPAGAYAEVDGKPFDGVSRAISYTVDAPRGPHAH